MLTHSLALELAIDGIMVNTVAPAYVESAMGRQALEYVATRSGITVDEAQAQRDSAIPLRRQGSCRRDAVPCLSGGVLYHRGVPGH